MTDPQPDEFDEGPVIVSEADLIDHLRQQITRGEPVHIFKPHGLATPMLADRVAKAIIGMGGAIIWHNPEPVKIAPDAWPRQK